MPVRPRSDVRREGLTPVQARLLDRHRRGLVRLARVLAEKVGRDPTDVMFLLAHEASNVGSIVREKLGDRVVARSEAVVVPGLATELVTWLTRLALAGPVYDCTNAKDGVPVIVIDQNNEMAHARLPCLTTADSADPGNRSIIPPS